MLFSADITHYISDPAFEIILCGMSTDVAVIWLKTFKTNNAKLSWGVVAKPRNVSLSLWSGNNMVVYFYDLFLFCRCWLYVLYFLLSHFGCEWLCAVFTFVLRWTKTTLVLSSIYVVNVVSRSFWVHLIDVWRCST